MRILFAGDSITEGKVGVSFVNMLRRDNTAEMVNAGVGGDTLLNIAERVLQLLKEDNAFDYIVIEAGYNDIILPSFRKRGLLMWLLYWYLIYKGQRPSNTAAAFREAYTNLIGVIQAQTKAQIILATLGCINERLDKPTNSKRQEYNEVIKHVALENNCLVADAGVLFDAALKEGKQTDYLMNNLMLHYFKSKLLGKTSLSPDQLSQKRGLQLTLDGVHLNTLGAILFKQAIETALI